MLFIQMRTVIHFLLLVQTWGEINLASNKPATQSGNFVDSSGDVYQASRAVDGEIGTFSYTEISRDVNWWRVDLGAKYTFGSIRIYNRGGSYNHQLSRTSILTSNATSPSTPSLTSNDWTRVTFQEPAYGDVGTHTFNPPIEGQYVAVYNEEYGGIALAEVEVYDYNYALSKPTDSSSNEAASYKAVDGDRSTVFSTIYEQSPWWKVNFGEFMLLKEVLVFVKLGTQLTNVYFLTNPSNTATEPNAAGNDGWNQCRYSQQALDDYQTVQCNIGYYTYPLTRVFSIRSAAETRIELRQVEVYGFELPQLSGNIDGKADAVTTTSITVSFLQWNQLMTGCSPPSAYTVQLSGGGSKTLAHNSYSERLSTTFNGLDVAQTYTFTVLCTIQGIACAGPTRSFTGSTSCAVPDTPGQISLSAVERQHDSKQKWEYTATWGAPNRANCADAVKYQYNVTGEPTSALQTATTAIFNVDGNQLFQFIVKAKNSVGFSLPRNKNGRSGVLKPQFGSGRISVTGKNSTCVTATWSEPLYPGGTITQYQHSCDGESWMDVGGNEAKDSCGHLPYTQITCCVRAKNSAGWGTATQSAGRTDCDVPTAPQDVSIALVEVEQSERNRWRLTADWKAPSKANCAEAVQYQYNLNGEPTSALQNATTAIFYRDGDLPFEFIVMAKNSVGFSLPTSKNGRSGILKPQFGSGRMSVTGKNSTCVTVTWSEPLYPGGTITQYQHRCDGESWRDAGRDSTKESCNHLPYAQITCWVRAKSAAGWGITPSAGITNCDVPTAPRDISIALVEVEHSGRNRWRLTADWKAPSRSNCNGAIEYKYGIQGVPTSTLQSEMSVTYHLEGDQSYDFVVQAKNSVGFSPKLSESGKTDPLDNYEYDRIYIGIGVGAVVACAIVVLVVVLVRFKRFRKKPMNVEKHGTEGEDGPTSTNGTGEYETIDTSAMYETIDVDNELVTYEMTRQPSANHIYHPLGAETTSFSGDLRNAQQGNFDEASESDEYKGPDMPDGSDTDSYMDVLPSLPLDDER